MSGWAIVLGPCCSCGHLIGFNPHRVPSYKGEPICEPCMRAINEVRVANGLPAIAIDPEAYEPIEAGQL